ncbi:MAG: MarR family transcriptional regulator [Flavobacteriales bacterium]|jgi:DNA-binding MarR family transcriptional regulator
MRLEEELQQDGFQSEHQKAVLNILFTSNWLESYSARVLKPFGISSQQYNVLRILKGQGTNAISVNNIMSRMIDKMSNASRLVEKLRKKEFIERVTCEHDRRQVDVRITETGIALLKEADKEMNKFDGMKDKITEKEAVSLSKLLEKIRE